MKGTSLLYNRARYCYISVTYAPLLVWSVCVEVHRGNAQALSEERIHAP